MKTTIVGLTMGIQQLAALGRSTRMNFTYVKDKQMVISEQRPSSHLLRRLHWGF